MGVPLLLLTGVRLTQVAVHNIAFNPYVAPPQPGSAHWPRLGVLQQRTACAVAMPRKAVQPAPRQGSLDRLMSSKSAVRARLGNDEKVDVDYIEACGAAA